MKRTTNILSSALAVSLLLAATIADARMYRYKDENGRTVISSTVPQQASQRGYEILDNRGRVINTIAPAPTPEEIAAREAEVARQHQLQLQQERDLALLKRFSHPDEAVRAMERKLQELESFGQLKRGSISVLANQLDSEQTRAANLERSGRDIPAATLQKIQRLQNQILDVEQEIAEQNAEIDKVRARFVEDIIRLETITGEPATLPYDSEPNPTP
ncbi:DUF4124 domain-containing protein [Marinobacter sp. SS21]|uniref:DUF4124 domain-containing protein n=1 Tax=Marinobacter sp. SS21 TaxID=2979460 RepID=UPI00232EB2A9|nr:DUF4124 domain-containing protein [Marinobacter sp. SS21]MDC0663976.1 DUF4124 domain-containing protein [Marinobacter sp. SS21]